MTHRIRLMPALGMPAAKITALLSRKQLREGDVEPPRVCRRPVCLSHSASAIFC